MAESIASLRRVLMTGSITWNSKKQGVDQADLSITIFFQLLVIRNFQRSIPDSSKDIIRVF